MKQKLYYTLNASGAYQVHWVPSWWSIWEGDDKANNQADAAAPENHASESQDLACMCKHAYCVDENPGSHDTPLSVRTLNAHVPQLGRPHHRLPRPASRRAPIWRGQTKASATGINLSRAMSAGIAACVCTSSAKQKIQISRARCVQVTETSYNWRADAPAAKNQHKQYILYGF